MDQTHPGAAAGSADTELQVTVDERLFALVPDYVLGLILLPAVDVAEREPVVADLLTAAEDEVHGAALAKADVAALPSIDAWRQAYRAVGVNPNRFPCAAESVLQRVAKGDRLPRINALVDLCNSVSLATRLPVASCNLDDIVGGLSVRLADGSETYLPLGSPDAPEQPDPGEIVYADIQGRAHSRRWNWRQSDVIRTDSGQHRILMTVEAVHPDGHAAVAQAIGRITYALDGLPGGDHRGLLVLDRATPSGELAARAAVRTH